MHHSNGLSRVEVVLLLGIVAILGGIVVPAIEQMRQTAQQASCRNSLRQVGIALANYHDHHKSYPYGCLGNPEFSPSQRWSWYPELAPLFGSYPRPPIDYMKPSDDARNVPTTFEAQNAVAETTTFHFGVPASSICPNGIDDTGALKQPLATYVGMAGVGRNAAELPLPHKRAGMWGYDRLTTQADVEKTAASTIHVIETAAHRGSWYRGGPATVRPYLDDGWRPIGKDGQFGGFHRGVAMTLFADGSVKPLSHSIDKRVFRSMATIADD